MVFTRPSPAITLGSSHAWPLKKAVVLHGKELQKHKHIMGTSGVGKSKFNAHIATSLIMQGVPCSIIDPHADLAHDVLSLLHQQGYFQRPNAYNKLWYIDFAHPSRYLPLNVLQQPYTTQTTVRNLLEAVKRVFPALANGAAPVFENVLQYSAVLLAENKLPITQAAAVLTNDDFRAKLLATCTHQDTLDFFHTRFARWEAKERTHNIESTLNKISIFTFTDTLKHPLNHSENRLNIRALLDKGISVLFNLGNLDQETRHLLGSLIMVGFEQATLSRADLLESQRNEYHVLVDEFPQFSSRNEESFTTFLSEARKFKVRLTLSHQTGMQISDRFRSALQNALPIIFRLGRPDSLWGASLFGKYDPYRVKHTVSNEEAEDKTHPVFFGLPEQVEDMAQIIEDLREQEAFIKLQKPNGQGFHTRKFKTTTLAQSSFAPKSAVLHLREYYANTLLVPRPASSVSVPDPVPQIQHTAHTPIFIAKPRKSRIN